MRLNPSEILIPDSLNLTNGFQGHITKIADWHYELARCEQNIKHHFKTITLDGFGVQGKPMAIRSSGAIIDYLENTHSDALKLLTHLSTYTMNDFMTLDASTRRNLELTETIRTKDQKGSLLHVLDHAATPMGHRLLWQWVSKPLLKIEDISLRQNGIEFLKDHGLLRAELFQQLKKINDLERLISRVISGFATPRDITSIRTTLQNIPELISLFEVDQNHPLKN